MGGFNHLPKDDSTARCFWLPVPAGRIRSGMHPTKKAGIARRMIHES